MLVSQLLARRSVNLIWLQLAFRMTAIHRERAVSVSREIDKDSSDC